MARRKSKAEDIKAQVEAAPDEEPAEAPEEEEEASEPEVPPRVAEYTEGVWAGHPNYQCVYCRFATVSLPLIQNHIHPGE